MITRILKYVSILLLYASTAICAPALFYTDLTSGPNTGGENNNGVWVSIYGERFGETRGSSTVTFGGGSVASYTSWSDSKVVVQIGASAATGNIVVSVGGEQSNVLPFTVRSGDIYFVAPDGTGDGSISSPFSPADYCTLLETGVDGATAYFRAGTYTGEYAHTGWRSNFTLKNSHGGSSGAENSFIGYPGETAILSAVSETIYNNFRRYDSGGDHGGGYYVIANFTMEGNASCVYVGSNSRVIGNTLTGCTVSSPAGVIGIDGTADGLFAVSNIKIYGNTIGGGTAGTTLDHAIYPGYGCDNIDIGWNVISSADSFGTKISVNHNDAYDLGMVFENIRIHDNIINTTSSIVDGRAIGVYETGENSTIYVYNNIIQGATSGTSSILYGCSGNIYYYNNLIYGSVPSVAGLIEFYQINVYGHVYNVESAYIGNNILYSSDGSGYYIESNISPTISNNCFYGMGSFDDNISCATCIDTGSIETNPLLTNVTAGDYTLTSISPCIGAGADLSSIFTTDLIGFLRGAVWDIGPYEYEEGEVLAYDAPTITGPEDFSTTSSSVEIEGTYTVDSELTADTVTWTLGESSGFCVAALGVFSCTVPVELGANSIVFTVTDSNAGTASDSIVINRTSSITKITNVTLQGTTVN